MSNPQLVAALQPGRPVHYCNQDGAQVSAQIVRVEDADAGVVDLAVYTDGGMIDYGVENAIRAVTPQDRITPGRWF